MTKSMRQTMSRRQKPESGEAEQEYKADTYIDERQKHEPGSEYEHDRDAKT